MPFVTNMEQVHRIPRTLVGNWSEDYQRSYEELRAFLAKRAAGELEIQRCSCFPTLNKRPILYIEKCAIKGYRGPDDLQYW